MVSKKITTNTEAYSTNLQGPLGQYNLHECVDNMGQSWPLFGFIMAKFFPILSPRNLFYHRLGISVSC